MEAATAVNNGTETLDGLAEDGEGLEELYIEGTQGQLSLNVGGRKPDTSTVSLRGGQIAVEGQLQKGDTVTLLITARVGEVVIADKMDPAGFVKATTRRHVLRTESVRRLENEEEED